MDTSIDRGGSTAERASAQATNLHRRVEDLESKVEAMRLVIDRLSNVVAMTVQALDTLTNKLTRGPKDV